MRAQTLLDDLQRRGHEVVLAPGGALAVGRASTLTAEDRTSIRQWKPELVELLSVVNISGDELPADRRDWPESATREFWALVKWFNADARSRGVAVEGKDRFAFEYAGRAVREAWRFAAAPGGCEVPS